LAVADQTATEEAAQRLAATICRELGVPPVKIRVSGMRPHDQRGELHGLYDPRQSTPIITVWMRTAKRLEVVAVKTFLRTLLHEICHHLDYHLLGLTESYHTAGFYQRESSLLRIVALGSPHAPRRRGGKPPGRNPNDAAPLERAQRSAIASASSTSPMATKQSGPTRRGIELLRTLAAQLAARTGPGGSRSS
jgi:hypothetical protein